MWIRAPGRAAGGCVLGGAHPGDHGGGEAEQPAAPPGPGAAGPGGHLGAGQPMPHLDQHRRVQHVHALDIGRVAEDVDPGARPRGGQQDALAAQRGAEPAQQVRLHPRPRVVDVEHAAGRPVGLRPVGREQGPVDPVLGHQLRGLGRQGLRLRRGHALVLGLGQQLVDALQEPARCLGVHLVSSALGVRIQYRTLARGSDSSGAGAGRRLTV